MLISLDCARLTFRLPRFPHGEPSRTGAEIMAQPPGALHHKVPQLS